MDVGGSGGDDDDDEWLGSWEDWFLSSRGEGRKAEVRRRFRCWDGLRNVIFVEVFRAPTNLVRRRLEG